MDDVQQLARDQIEYERSMAHVRYDHNKVIFARGWLIERARTNRLRKKLAEAQRLAEMHRDAYIDLHTDIYPSTNIPWQCGPMFWEADQAAKGGE